MIATTIREPPLLADYIPLAEYESQTPASFTGRKPVLHLHLVGATLQALGSQASRLAIFAGRSAGAEGTEGARLNGESGEDRVVEQKADVLVTSEKFIVFSEQAGVGVSLPYPAISIHALKHVGPEHEARGAQAGWMQIENSDGGSGDDDFDMIELTIIPPAAPAAAAAGEDGQGPAASPAQKLFEAMSNCADLHPGAEDDEDDTDRIIVGTSVEPEALEGFTGVLRGATDGGLPPPMPGSGGWITAENMHEYFDEDGAWIGPGGDDGEHPEGAAAEGELGEGAGRIRGRDEVEPEGVNGHADDEDPENKRPRVD